MDIWDEEDVLQMVEEITNDPPFVERDSEYDRRRELLFQQRFVSIPGITVDAAGRPKTGMVQYRSPEIEDHANKFKNRMLAAPLKINVAAVRKGQSSVDAAQRQEDFFYRHYYRWRDQGVFDGILFDQASVGIGWAHLALNTDLLPIIPEGDGEMELAADALKEFSSGEKPNLFVLERTDAATMYWNPDHSIRIQKALVPFTPLVDQYAQKGIGIELDDDAGTVLVSTLEPGQNFRTRRVNWARQVYLYTLETADYCYHVLYNNKGNQEGALLGAYRNYFGTPAFFPVIGERTGSSHPLFAYRPMLNGKYQTVPPKNILTTAMMTAGSEAGQQRYTVRWLPGQGPEPPDNANIVVTISEDGMIIPPPGYEVVNAGLQVGPDLPTALQHIEQIDVYGLPPELSSPGEVSATSGYDRARQQGVVASLLDPPLSHFGSMLQDVFKAMLVATSELDVPITVKTTQSRPSSGRQVTVQQSVTLKPEDTREDTDIAVEFDALTILDRISMQEEGMKLMQADQLSETDFQTDIMGTTNMDDFRYQRSLDKVLKSADDLAVSDAQNAIKQFAQQAQQKAISDNNIPVVSNSTTPPMLPTNGEMIRSDRGPGTPVGPGQAIPSGGQAPPAPPMTPPEVMNG